MEKPKTGSFVPKNRKQEVLLYQKISLCSETFASIAKFRYVAKFSLA